MPFEQSVLHIPLIIIGSQQETAKRVPLDWLKIYITAQKMKFSITDFFSVTKSTGNWLIQSS